jgi:hypothetical protein
MFGLFRVVRNHAFVLSFVWFRHVLRDLEEPVQFDEIDPARKIVLARSVLY